MTGGGSSTQRKSSVVDAASSLDSLTFQSTIPQNPHSPSDAKADIAAQPGVSFAGTSAELEAPSGSGFPYDINAAVSHQRTNVDNPDLFDDAPYVPPRVTPAGLQTYPSNHDIQRQYSYEASTGDSLHNAESNWGACSSSASTQYLPQDYLAESTSQYSQHSQPLRHATHAPYYPAYHGQQRVGLEHVRYGEQPPNTGGAYYRNSPEDYLLDGQSLQSVGIFDDPTARVVVPSQANYTASSYTPSSSSSISPPGVSTFSVSLASPEDSGPHLFPDAGPCLRQQLGLSPHDPVDLYSLPDPPPGEKPSAPLPMLIKLAIYGSPNKQLTLQEIYAELEKRFQWFREHRHDKAWKNSIRHNLSLNKVFRLVPRPMTAPGKGSYWQLDMSGGEGYKRPRKRRTRNRATASEEEDEEASETEEDRASPLDSSQSAGFTRSSATPIEDVYIDPELRSEGHVVGEGRTRSATRRAGGGSPYPSQSPRYQQGSLPVVAEQDASATTQPLQAVRFGQPSFGQSSFPTYTHARALSATSSSSSFAAMSSSSMAMAPTTSTVAHPQVQHMASVSYDGTVPIPQLPLPPGIEYVMSSGGLPAARRVNTYLESQGHVAPSSSSGSSRTWNDARSGS